MYLAALKVGRKSLKIHCMSDKRVEYGFSLVELMVSLAILAILVSIAMPSYRSLIAEQRIEASVADLKNALALARSEAVKRNRAVSLSYINDGWSSGWRVANPVSGQPDLLNHVQIASVLVEGEGSAVSFSASGRVSSAMAFQFSSLVSEDTQKFSCLVIGLDGRVSSSKGKCL